MKNIAVLSRNLKIQQLAPAPADAFAIIAGNAHPVVLWVLALQHGEQTSLDPVLVGVVVLDGALAIAEESPGFERYV